MEDISLSGNFIVLFKDLSSIYIFPAENSCDGEGRGHGVHCTESSEETLPSWAEREPCFSTA